MFRKKFSVRIRGLKIFIFASLVSKLFIKLCYRISSISAGSQVILLDLKLFCTISRFSARFWALTPLKLKVVASRLCRTLDPRTLYVLGESIIRGTSTNGNNCAVGNSIEYTWGSDVYIFNRTSGFSSTIKNTMLRSYFYFKPGKVRKDHNWFICYTLFDKLEISLERTWKLNISFLETIKQKFL